jgi:2-oxoisovalerate dehydrogenase E1 component
MAGPVVQSSDGFLERLKSNRLPSSCANLKVSDVGLNNTQLWSLLESQMKSRRLDLESRLLAKSGKTYYSIGSSGHEGNAGLGFVFRHDDMAFLHYRSGAFFIERARHVAGSTPVWDMALSFTASSEDPISGGRHKVIGSKELFIPPQTSTIASHLPKAVGVAFSVGASKRRPLERQTLPHDSVVLCSFGDASSNHSTAQGAFNAAAWTAYRGLALPLIFVCEDNGLGISVSTPQSWIESNFSERPGLEYIKADGRDILDTIRAARDAEHVARFQQKPVFLHLKTVRLMGHAGSDLETQYRTMDEIEVEADQDPLLHTARHLIQSGHASLEDIISVYAKISEQVGAVMIEAATRPKLSSSREVMSSLVPPKIVTKPKKLELAWPTAKPQHMSRAISATISQQMEIDQSIVLFGEDVGRKGGVYGSTIGLQKQFGIGRIFDTLLDEQTILGLAIGMAHNGYLPIPEIQFLAYVHNAEDQIRGEAATLSFFSSGQFANPMVIRVAGLAYQKGFGGHFHNDNAIAVFRDIPGIIVACPSSASEAVMLLRESIRLAREEQRVVIFLEPIALYGSKDLFSEGDGLMLSHEPREKSNAEFHEVNVYPAQGKAECTIITYGNGVHFSRRVQAKLKRRSIHLDVIDLRWLVPLPLDSLTKVLDPALPTLIVDECRETGSLSEELIAKLFEAEFPSSIARINGKDSFIPLGPAADEVLLQEEEIERKILALIGSTK